MSTATNRSLGYVPGPYEDCEEIFSDRQILYVPPLTALCIASLASYPDQLAGSRVALSYIPQQETTQFDILKALIPSYSPDSDSFLSAVDPRLWVTLAQIFAASLPRSFSVYPIPLSDTHLPLLQCIPSTHDFSLLTILELPGCPQLTDDTALELSTLHSLVAFDASDTAFSSWGLKKFLSPCLWPADTREEEPVARGPWCIRILRLRNCKDIDSPVLKHLSKLPLLSVIDVRGTSVDPSTIPAPFNTWSSALLEPSFLSSLYHPTPLKDSVSSLKSTSENFHSSSSLFQLYIDRLAHVESRQRERDRLQKAYTSLVPQDSVVQRQDVAFTFTPDGNISETLTEIDDSNDSSSSKRRPGLDEDFMISVFDREARALAARQRIRNFYAPPPTLRLFSASVGREGYSATRYYRELPLREKRKRVAHDRKRETLSASFISPSTTPTSSMMLYRPPPPWSSLNQFVPPSLASEPNKRPISVAEQTAKVNKSHPMMQKFAVLTHPGKPARGRTTSARVQMATFDGPSTTTAANTPKSATTQVAKEDADVIQLGLHGRNPFRRPEPAVGVQHGPRTVVKNAVASSSKNVIGGLVWTSRTTPSALLQSSSESANTSTSSEPRKTSTVSLKPISSVRVPELPPEEAKKLKDSMKTPKPRASLPVTAPSSKSAEAGRLSSSTSARRRSLPATGGSSKDGNIQKMLERVSTTVLSHDAVNPSGGSNSSRANPPAKRRKTGFDWKSWGIQ